MWGGGGGPGGGVGGAGGGWGGGAGGAGVAGGWGVVVAAAWGLHVAACKQAPQKARDAACGGAALCVGMCGPCALKPKQVCMTWFCKHWGMFTSLK